MKIEKSCFDYRHYGPRRILPCRVSVRKRVPGSWSETAFVLTQHGKNRSSFDKKTKHGLDFTIHYGDLTDSARIIELVNKVKPDEIYNLAAQSHVSVSFEIPEYTSDVNALGTLRC